MCIPDIARRAVGLVTVAAVIGGVWAGVGWLLPLPTQASAGGPTLRLYAGTEEIAILHGLSRRAQIWQPL